MMLDHIALGLLVFVVVILFYGIIAIHDIPYLIAKKRNHPHQDAIHVTGWVSLLLLHTIWPFLWIWATLYREDRGWGFGDHRSIKDHVLSLETQLADLQQQVAQLQSLRAPSIAVSPAATPVAPPAGGSPASEPSASKEA